MLGTIIFIIIFLLSTIQDLTNKDTRRCIDLNSHIAIITILHHLFSNFILFGWIITPLWIVKLYLIALILTVIYWAIVGYCHISRYVNRTCQWNQNKYFNDLTYQLKQTKKERYLYLAGATMALYRIYVIQN